MNIDALLNWKPDPIVENYDERRTILYALGIGMRPEGAGLRYVFEQDLLAFPTMAVVLGHGEFFETIPEFEVQKEHVLHGEQYLEIHQPLTPRGRVAASVTVDAIKDRGAKKGAAVLWSRRLTDADSGEPIATARFVAILRGDGGFGRSHGLLPSAHVVPTRPADLTVSIDTRPEQAAIYRLSGDFNPLHIDPAFAARGGFDRPILHGLCSYAVAARAIVSSQCGDDPTRLSRFDVRFVSPVFPGETLSVDIWREGPDQAAFIARVAERDAIVLGNGLATWRAS